MYILDWPTWLSGQEAGRIFGLRNRTIPGTTSLTLALHWGGSARGLDPGPFLISLPRALASHCLHYNERLSDARGKYSVYLLIRGRLRVPRHEPPGRHLWEWLRSWPCQSSSECMFQPPPGRSGKHWTAQGCTHLWSSWPLVLAASKNESMNFMWKCLKYGLTCQKSSLFTFAKS